MIVTDTTPPTLKIQGNFGRFPNNREEYFKFIKDNNITLKLMTSKSGIFGSYGGEFRTINGNIYGRDKGYTFMLPHREMNGHESFLIEYGDKCYYRTLGDDRSNSAYIDQMPEDIRDFMSPISMYLSQNGFVTNLHYDKYSGIIYQCSGKKRVVLISPEYYDLFNMYPKDHPLKRRSKYDGFIDFTKFDCEYHEVIVNEGEYVFIPSMWLHYVETLDNDCISLITRFKILDKQVKIR